MYKNANDLSQLFADSPAPRRISDAVRSKIEKFKVHLFVLETICNPGLRERHWELMGEELGFEVGFAICFLSEPVYLGTYPLT